MENTIGLDDVRVQLANLMQELRVRVQALQALAPSFDPDSLMWRPLALASSLFGTGESHLSPSDAARITRQGLVDDAWLADPTFWGTPVGQVMAYFGSDAVPEMVSRLCAARALGVTRTRVGQLILDGKLVAGPDGVTRESLAARMREMFALDLD